MPDIEQQLRDLSAHLDVPEAPDVRAAVRSRLSTPPVRRWRPLVAAAAIVLVSVLAIPQARAAIGSIFSFAGIELRRDDSPPPSQTAVPLPSETTLPLDEARRTVQFPIAVPSALGPPESVTISDEGRVATLAWDGLRLDVFDGTLEPAFLKRARGAEYTTVNGEFAVWVPGPHSVVYVDRTGTEREETARLSGPTLIWPAGPVTYRLEGAKDVATAVRIAESVR